MNTNSDRSAAPRRPGRGLLISLVALLAALLLGEGAARLVWTRDELDPLALQMRRARIETHPYLAYANKPNYRKQPDAESPQQIAHNALGFRGPELTWEKPDGVFRVLCLGGSSTYGFGPSSDATTWPARLQDYLGEAFPERRFEVINGGCQGYSTFESLINLELRGTDLRPDLVLVYHTINDMRCALYPHVARDNTHWRKAFPVEWPDPVEEVLEHSYLFLAWRMKLTDWWAVRQNLGAWVIRDFGKYADDYAQPDPGDLGFRNTQRNLVDIVELVRRHGAVPVLVTQGMKPDGIPDVVASKQQQLAGLERVTAILRAVGAETDTPVIEAKAVLEEAAAGGANVFTNEVHLTDEGADLLARTLAQGLTERGLIR